MDNNNPVKKASDVIDLLGYKTISQDYSFFPDDLVDVSLYLLNQNEVYIEFISDYCIEIIDYRGVRKYFK